MGFRSGLDGPGPTKGHVQKLSSSESHAVHFKLTRNMMTFTNMFAASWLPPRTRMSRMCMI